MVSLPEGFKELQALVFLEMHHCPNLVDVQGLPWSLEYLDLSDCPQVDSSNYWETIKIEEFGFAWVLNIEVPT
jgi:hypothetical protein